MSESGKKSLEPSAPLPSFGPFRFRSELDLAPLRLPSASGGVLVEVRLGKTAHAAADIPAATGVTASPGRCLLDVPGLARFEVTKGSRVLIEPEAGADFDDLRGYLTAWVFGALCLQNDLLPLHSSAVLGESGIAAFLGRSGAGKSTLAAFLGRRGYAVLSDDICLLRPGAEGMRVVPVASWLKLWRGSLEQLGMAAQEADRTFSDEDKFRQYLPAAVGGERRLTHLVFVERTDEARPALLRLRTTEAVGRMMANIYLAYLVEPLGLAGQVFNQCAAVLREAEPLLLTAPWGWEGMDGVLQLLEAEVLGERRVPGV